MDRQKREFLLHLIKITGAFWLSRYIPFTTSYGCAKKRGYRVDPSLFPQSVASGDVTQTSVVLWTRVSTGEPIVCEVSKDEDFSELVFSEVLVPSAETDNTVKIKVANLQPGTRYYYRFVKDDLSSYTGTFKTLEKEPERIRFSFVSCQDYTNGFYSAWYHLAQEDLDFVIHLGDYIYETVYTPTFQYSQLRQITLPSGGKVALIKDDYRALYKVYRSDRYLQMAHERFPFYIIWDDHEFSNDVAGTFSPDNGREFYGSDYQPERRRIASEVWYDYQPVDVFFDRKETDPIKQIRIYRRFDFGTLGRLLLTDERLYRSPHPCGERQLGERYLAPYCDNVWNPERTMLGKDQLDWFLKELKQAENDGVIWKIHGNEVTMNQLVYKKDSTPTFLNFDQWDGYAYERSKILKFISDNNISNYFVVTGDFHSFVVGMLYENFFDMNSKRVGVEFTGTSITAANLGTLLRLSDELAQQIENFIMNNNQNILLFNSRYHGYVICDITREEAVVELWVVSDIQDPEVEKTTKRLLRRYRVKRNTNYIEDITPRS